MCGPQTKARRSRQSIEIFRAFASTAAFCTASLAASDLPAQTPTYLPTVITVAGNHGTTPAGDGGPASAAAFSSYIASVAMDPAGNLYVADYTGNAVRRMDVHTGIITTFAGGATAICSSGATDTVGDGCAATSATLKTPQAVRYHQGGIWIVDFGNSRIRRVDLVTGIITTVVGGGTATLKDSTDGSNFQATAVAIGQPQDVAFDQLGNLYYSQASGTSRVNIVNLSTGIIHEFAGTGGTAGATGTNGPSASCTFTQPRCVILNGPYGIVVDAQNNVYVDETATHVIRKITVGTNPTISTYAGIGISSGAAICAQANDSVGDGCPATGAMLGPPGNLSPAPTATIAHMSIDGNGNIYLADNYNNRVRVIPPNPSNPAVGGTVYTIAGTGVATSSPDGSYPQNTAIGMPWDAQILPTGDLLIADRALSAVRLSHLPGTFGQGGLGVTPTSGLLPATQTVEALTQSSGGSGSFTLPGATDFSGAGPGTCAQGVNVPGIVCAATVTFTPTLSGLRTNALTFTDANGSVNAGVYGLGLAPVASLLPGLMGTVAGTGTAGATGDGGAATSASLQKPGSVTTDVFGNVYIADTANNEIRKISPGGTITRVAGTGVAGSSGDGGAATSATLSAPQGVALDPGGNIYIADTGNNKIRYVDSISGNISTVAGTGSAGYAGDLGPPASAAFNAPAQIAFGPNGQLYVADSGNDAIRVISFGESLVTTFAGTPVAAGGPVAGFDGDGTPALGAKLNAPQGVTADQNGNVWIADTGNNRIRMVTPAGGISTIAGQQGGGFLGDGTATATELNAPVGLAVDGGGTLYIADTLNQRIRVISNGVIATVAGTGAAGTGGDGGTSASGVVNGPQGVALDSIGNVYIADTGNNQVRRIAVNGNSLTYKTLNPGESSPAQTVSLFNSGNQPLTLTGVSVPQQGYVEQASGGSAVDCSLSTLPLTLAAGASCNLNTVFDPPAIGSYNSSISLTDTSQASGTAMQTISLTASSQYVFTAQIMLPGSATAGVAVSGILTVKNPQATYTGTVKFTSTDPQAVLPANYTFKTSDMGSYNFAVSFKTAGPQCVTATDTSNNTITSTQCATVVAGSAAKIAVVGGNNQSANVSAPYAQRLVVLVTDAYGNPVQKAPVVFTLNASGSATGVFSTGKNTDSETTDLSGYATSAAVTSGATVGAYTATAALTGTSSTVTFNLTIVVLGSFTIVPASTMEGPQVASFSFSDNLTVVGVNGFNAPITFTCKAPSGTSCSVGGTGTQNPNLYTLFFQGEGGLRTAGMGTRGWLALLTLLSASWTLRKRRLLGRLAASAFMMLCLGIITGCGEYYAPTTGNGSYTVTVTGTAQTASATTSVTFIIQN